VRVAFGWRAQSGRSALAVNAGSNGAFQFGSRNIIPISAPSLCVGRLRSQGPGQLSFERGRKPVLSQWSGGVLLSTQDFDIHFRNHRARKPRWLGAGLISGATSTSA
jgi:hypothetical protein